MKLIIKSLATIAAGAAATTIGCNAGEYLWSEVLKDKVGKGIKYVHNKMDKRKKPKEEEA